MLCEWRAAAHTWQILLCLHKKLLIILQRCTQRRTHSRVNFALIIRSRPFRHVQIEAQHIVRAEARAVDFEHTI